MRCSSQTNTHRSLSPVIKALSVALIMLAATSNLQAEVSVSTHISTIGPGIELGYKLSPAFGVRAGWQQFATDFDFKPEDENGVPGDELTYEGDLDLKNGSLMADWYPYQGRFRLTAGLLLNNSGTKLTTNCKTNTAGTVSVANSCEVGGSSVSGSDIGEVDITIDFEERIAPYIGLGWAFQQGKSWFISADLGVAFLGKANADIQTTGSCNNTESCRSQLDDEEREIEEDMESLEFFPVAKLGFGYRF
ncbi:hypothetical protein [Zhongshania sp.]|uniref:hypothetical protein n=1 Tax=Zhongshania sp. TaxID=1971902 RepID=UPI002A7EFD09|nr:hypothetical protein [Zhongshania sp.]